MDDPRLTPARGDLAAKYLEGKVKAKRFVTGEEFVEADAAADAAGFAVVKKPLGVDQLRRHLLTVLESGAGVSGLRASP